jgi:hypothetical protein
VALSEIFQLMFDSLEIMKFCYGVSDHDLQPATHNPQSPSTPLEQKAQAPREDASAEP